MVKVVYSRLVASYGQIEKRNAGILLPSARLGQDDDESHSKSKNGQRQKQINDKSKSEMPGSPLRGDGETVRCEVEMSREA
jgi:hypothetical protein